ncbi:unnamed protein product, partial [Sphenostylis stenocarpa]
NFSKLSEQIKKMTVVEDHKMDEFPRGMRVLAVDDDSTCLMILETMLRRCQYHVLSVNDDPKMVMKGITHGACDYLLKPVRIKEIQNIWQHVVRRKTIDSKEWNKTSYQDNVNADSNERGSVAKGNSDQIGKSSRKRKDEDEDDYEENENGHYNEDSSSHKKPRVVWSVELHRKFVSAVNQLGFEKAVPKKILDLMNVEKLTRENKYRLYLKRINSAANRQANMVVALGTADSSYLRMDSLSGVGHLTSLTGAQQFHNNTFRPFGSGGMAGRLNTSFGVNVHGLPSSETLQLGHAQNLHKSIHDPLKFQPTITCGNQNGIQGISMSTGLDQFQHNKGVSVGVSPIQNISPLIDVQPNLSIPNKLPDLIPKAIMGCSPSPVLDISNNALVLKAESENTQGSGMIYGQTSLASQHSQFSLPLLEQGRCSDIWSNSAAESSGINSYPPSETFQVRNLSCASSITTLSNESHDPLKDMHSQGVFFPNNSGQISNNVAPFQVWNDNNDDSTFHSNIFGNSIDALIDTDGHSSINSTYNRNTDFSFFYPSLMKPDGIMGLSEENTLKQQQEYTLNQNKSQNNRAANNLVSLEEFVSSMTNQELVDWTYLPVFHFLDALNRCQYFMRLGLYLRALTSITFSKSFSPIVNNALSMDVSSGALWSSPCLVLWKFSCYLLMVHEQD